MINTVHISQHLDFLPLEKLQINGEGRRGHLGMTIIGKQELKLEKKNAIDTATSNHEKYSTRRTTHELTQLCCITHVSGSTTTQLCCITHPSGKYYHSVVLYNSPEWKVLPLS